MEKENYAISVSELEGVYTAMITPMDDSRNLDIGKFEELLKQNLRLKTSLRETKQIWPHYYPMGEGPSLKLCPTQLQILLWKD